MSVHTCRNTNEAINQVIEDVKTLIQWAEGDAQHAEENDATETAEDDRYRADLLRKVVKTLQHCYR